MKQVARCHSINVSRSTGIMFEAVGMNRPASYWNKFPCWWGILKRIQIMQVLNITETCLVRDREYKIPFNITVNRMHAEMEMCFLAQVPPKSHPERFPIFLYSREWQRWAGNEIRSESLCKMKLKSVAAPVWAANVEAGRNAIRKAGQLQTPIEPCQLLYCY